MDTIFLKMHDRSHLMVAMSQIMVLIYSEFTNMEVQCILMEEIEETYAMKKK